jgi:hypothetical protein
LLVDVFAEVANLIKDNLGYILTLGALYVAYRALMISTKSFNEHNRPYITANIEKGDSPYHIYLIIRNNGVRGARDVRIKFDPPLKSQVFKNQPEINEITERNYAFIAPQQTIKTTFDITLHRFAEGVECENKINIDIDYKCAKRTFTDKYYIDIDYIRHLIGPNESDVKKGLEQLDKTLSKLVVNTDRIAGSIRKDEQ